MAIGRVLAVTLNALTNDQEPQYLDTGEFNEYSGPIREYIEYVLNSYYNGIIYMQTLGKKDYKLIKKIISEANEQTA